MGKTVLSIENITVQFGGVLAVDNLSMQVNEGEIVSLIGPNGAGKTTAFNAITGVYQATNGRVVFNEKVILESRPTGKMRKLYAGENAGLYHKMIKNTPDPVSYTHLFVADVWIFFHSVIRVISPRR